MRKSKVFIGSSNPELGRLVCDRLGVEPAPCTLTKFSNGETSVSIGVSVRDEDTYVIQSGSSIVNDNIMELLILVSALRGGSAKRITAILPYFPYSKQSKMKKHRGAIVAKMVSNLMVMAGVDHVITVDLHSSQMQGFFHVPVDNLYSAPLLARWIRHNVEDWQNAVVVSKNPGGTKRVTGLADMLKIDFAMINTDKRRKPYRPSRPTYSRSSSMAPQEDNSAFAITESEFITARIVQGRVVEEDYSEETGNDSGQMSESIISIMSATEHALGGTVDAEVNSSDDEEYPIEAVKEPADIERIGREAAIKSNPTDKTITLVGNVRDRTAIIVDDILDRPDSFINAAEHCRFFGGAKHVVIVATHGVLSADSLNSLENEPCIDRVVVTNTFPIDASKRTKSKKLVVIDMSSLLAECIRRNHYGESIASLFDKAFLE
ncbi:hypothetical protein CANCADRAFT_123561 [Tortispora caseinolytica NRRL Y-17796]|uniref:Ribose-phosphate pyrophosphokinase 1 n=1 Tax=Tortispora caseinolytica NRRL Y-17796 TaxID=767744 RepID=A0A1E4TI29_9ASCO|nr:hypothetical protein CANCADRAFT_123561 [Tortispora caseinolytica NRRL Y-17796]